jgi:uncharacterized protein (TIGR02466 family)
MKQNNYNILNLWPTPIYIGEIPVKKSYLDFIHKIKFERATNQRFDISKDKAILNQMPDLKLKIQNHINIFVRNHLKINNRINFYLTDSWVNRFEKGEGSTTHSHVNSMISGVYYFKRAPNMGGIQFQKGYQINHNIFYPDIWMEYDEANETQGQAFNITPEEGGIILFPSKVEHTVIDNLSDTTRYSLAFNTHVKGKFIVKDISGKPNYELIIK